jgi:16S rRNA (guanine527-N7)-methyltransferase
MATDSGRAHQLPHIRGAEDFAAVFDVSRETIDRLAAYERLLRQWQRAVNLVAPSTLDDVWHRHFADSAQLVSLAPTARTWVDLGSGAGFPGLVVAMMFADRYAASPSPRLRHAEGVLSARREGRGEGQRLAPTPLAAPHPNPLPMPQEAWGEGTRRVTLIESNARKCAFLREVVRETGIGACALVDILSTRIETAATQASLHGPDIVSARALAPLGKLFDLAAPLFASITVGLFLKGRDVAAELEAAKTAWKFKSELVPSRTEHDGRIAVVRELEPKTKGMKP